MTGGGFETVTCARLELLPGFRSGVVADAIDELKAIALPSGACAVHGKRDREVRGRPDRKGPSSRT